MMEMDGIKQKSFFSVAFDLVTIDLPIDYDLYVNSSANASKEKFVRIFPKGDILSKDYLDEFKKKYFQLYVNENQRNLYLKSMVKSPNASDIQKTEVIKDSAITYLEKVFDKSKSFSTEVLNETIEGCRESVETMVDLVQDYSVSDIQKLIGSLSFHDFYTYDHSINVSMYCISILKALDPKVDADDLSLIGLGGLLHDLGKLKIPTEIINCPDKLTDEQFQTIKKHPGYGGEILSENKIDSKSINTNVLRRMITEHHENFDGSGYPRGLKGEEIHLFARINAIADVFDAVTTKRSYQEVMDMNEAIDVLARFVGKRFDPQIFEVFLKSVNLVVHKRRPTRELPLDFDPSSPHSKLPLIDVKAQKLDVDIIGEKSTNYGKVKKVNEIK